jgi:YaiO family outer membrane protein
VIAIYADAVAGAVSPNDTYATAVAARIDGRTREAIAAFEQLAKDRPRDADVWLNLGISYGAAKRYVQAERALQQSLALAPSYPDAQLAYARVAWFRGDFPAARARLAALLAGPPQAEAQALSRQIAAAEAAQPTAWRIDLTLSRSRLTRGLPDWSTQAANLSRRFPGHWGVGFGVEHTRRFGVSDTFVEAVVAPESSRFTEAYVAVGGAPDADYRARVAVRSGVAVEALRPGPWSLRLGADVGWSRYRVGDVYTVQPFVVVTRRGANVTLRSVNTLDEHKTYRRGYAVRLDGAVAPRLRLSAGWADAPESSDGVTVKVRAASAGAVFDLNDSTTLRLDATHDMRDAYDRDEAAISISKRF